MLRIRKIGILRRGYRHLMRYRQILSILVKYGFGDMIDVLGIERYFEVGLQMLSRKRREQVEHLSRVERVRMALEELGPTFIKLGQVMSTRPDLVPGDLVRELSKLQDQVPPFEYDQAKEIVEAELNSSIEDVFQVFEEKPLAAASIGQVHRAKLKDGEEVVVKVQRPGIRNTIEVDLEIMLHLASLAEHHIEEWEYQRPTRIVEEFARTIEREIDYTVEASHVERFARQFQTDMSIYVPKVYREESTERVLTMEFIDGIKISETGRIEEEGLDRKLIARRGTDLILEQIFKYGFFHADPHPGNIYILPGNVICYLDYGMMGRVDRRTREHFAELVHGCARRDESKTTTALLQITEYEQPPDQRLLERDVADFMEQHLYKPLKDMDIGRLLQQLLDLACRHRLEIPQDLFLMMKALTTVEGVGVSLDPDFDLMERTTPFIRRIRMEHMHPKRIVGDLLESSADVVRLAQEIPGELREIFKQIKQGQIRIRFEHRGLDPILATHDQVSNRISFSIIIAALVVGSALIVLSKAPPLLYGISVIGIGGFVIAAMMGLWLLVAILRRGRL
ncbi:MAG: AarF/ABC1/UbiB kinase family protein [Candidatus Eisenbacteria sp.]|nr:AarF/ABC1/UbiB kinase family protein [Candidatus Eisenbacteria bacterium]